MLKIFCLIFLLMAGSFFIGRYTSEYKNDSQELLSDLHKDQECHSLSQKQSITFNRYKDRYETLKKKYDELINKCTISKTKNHHLKSNMNSKNNNISNNENNLYDNEKDVPNRKVDQYIENEPNIERKENTISHKNNTKKEIDIASIKLIQPNHRLNKKLSLIRGKGIVKSHKVKEIYEVDIELAVEYDDSSHKYLGTKNVVITSEGEPIETTKSSGSIDIFQGHKTSILLDLHSHCIELSLNNMKGDELTSGKLYEKKSSRGIKGRYIGDINFTQ